MRNSRNKSSQNNILILLMLFTNSLEWKKEFAVAFINSWKNKNFTRLCNRISLMILNTVTAIPRFRKLPTGTGNSE